MISSRHKMILSSGRFSGTSREQLAAAFDTDRPVQQKADPWAWVRVPIRNASGRKVDAITAEQPLDVPVERHGRGEPLAHYALLPERPKQRAPGDRGRAEMGRVAVEVVDGDIAAIGLDAFRVLVERQDQ